MLAKRSMQLEISIDYIESKGSGTRRSPLRAEYFAVDADRMLCSKMRRSPSPNLVTNDLARRNLEHDIGHTFGPELTASAIAARHVTRCSHRLAICPTKK